MKNTVRFLGIVTLLAATAAGARDERQLQSIDAALNSARAKDLFDDTVQFYWGDHSYPQPLPESTIIPRPVRGATRKTFALTKTDLEACDWAFLSSLVALRDEAKKEGANAIVNLKSLYENREFRSETQYECRAGYVATGVTLEGKLVKLAPAYGVTTVRPAN